MPLSSLPLQVGSVQSAPVYPGMQPPEHMPVTVSQGAPWAQQPHRRAALKHKLIFKIINDCMILTQQGWSSSWRGRRDSPRQPLLRTRKEHFLVALKKQSNKKRCMAWHKMQRYLLAHLRQIDLQCFAGSKFDRIAKFGSYCLTGNLLRVAG